MAGTVQKADTAPQGAPNAVGRMATAVRPVLLSEWTKLRTVRSTPWTLGTVVAVTVLLGLGFSWLTRHSADGLTEADLAALDPTATSLAGLNLAQLAVVVLAVLSVSAEYSTGLLAVSLHAVPRRGLFYGCKAAVLAGVTLLTGWAASAAAFGVGRLAMGDYAASVFDPGVLRALLGAGLYLALLALFSYGVAMALRSAVPALGVLMPLFFLVSPLLSVLPATERFAGYLPDTAGMRITQTGLDGSSAWTGLGVLLVWVALALALGYSCLRARDAHTG